MNDWRMGGSTNSCRGGMNGSGSFSEAGLYWGAGTGLDLGRSFLNQLLVPLRWAFQYDDGPCPVSRLLAWGLGTSWLLIVLVHHHLHEDAGGSPRLHL